MHIRPHLLLVCAITITIAVITGNCAAQERTSNSNAQLKRWLKRFPQADANRDGVLTESEARAFRQRKQRPKQRGGAKPTPTHANVAYGPHKRNVLDLWLAKSEKPTPLIIYIHGGGFGGGDKRSIQAAFLTECLKSGISVAAIHYRFVTEKPFPTPQHDAARAIQFLRYNAKGWNLDPTRFAAYGGSAGAGLSLWLAFHKDLADPENGDPVLRQSSRLIAAGSFGGQSTYDPFVIKAWIGGRAWQHPSIYKCYGVTTLDGLKNPKLQKLYDEVSAIKHLTKDDPPVFMFYSEANKPLPKNARPGQGIHHPIFGFKLRDAMKTLGIETVYRHRDDRKGDPHREMLQFFQKQFKRANQEQ